MTIRESEILDTAALDAYDAYLRFCRLGLTPGEATAAAIQCPQGHPMPYIAEDTYDGWLAKAMRHSSGPRGVFYARCAGVRDAMTAT